MEPIWKDDALTLNADTQYSVWTLNALDAKVNQIYSGRAVPPPAGTAKVYLNRIVKGFLSQKLTTVGKEDVDYQGNFGMYNAADTLLKKEKYYLDWSYIASPSPLGLGVWLDFGPHPAACPIVITFEPGSYDLAITNDLNTYTFTTTTGANVYIDAQPTATSVTISDSVSDTSRTISLLDNCQRYALYFVNAFGGWSTLGLDGLTTVEDTYSRSTYSRDYDNSTPANRGDVNYLNTFKRKYTLRTGWLSDEISENMFHLFGSTLVYLYDSTASVFVPVTLTGTAYRHKSYKDNGRALVSFDIAATEAHNFERR